ncbi:MAG: bifunctional adenosylcobinamide kinase/adenosylcobinamide-phosphate guanylyltransferase [Selenomonadaceae bacterium]|nr:bifunctional adenosylcobinamide kinase/adenosylcobinamide-phosphate guanylyltransferase [Selenomonadaceae bacterium]
MGKIVLITGGARSGKSEFAERYAKKFGKIVSYIATAEIYDDEMRARVDLHKKRRPREWKTYECPKDAHIAIEEAGKYSDLILFDCLTVYLSNLILSMEDNIDETKVNQAIDLLIAAAKKISAATVFVTNEVGAGIVPENKLARIFRDMAGRVNQKMASNADDVYLVVSGCAIDLKKFAVNI